MRVKGGKGEGRRAGWLTLDFLGGNFGKDDNLVMAKFFLHFILFRY